MCRAVSPSRLWVVLAAALFVAACGGSDDTATEISLDYAESPINDLLGIDIEVRDGDLIALEHNAEVGVAECMKAAGFEYRPVDFSEQFGGGPGEVDTDSREFAELSGYGISTRPLSAFDPAELADPNDDIRAGLSTAELEAYQQALYGNAPPDGEPISLADQDGCVAESYATLYEAEGQLQNVGQFFSDFADELTALEERLRSDPRFIELEEQWSACMNDQGYSVATREDIFVELQARMAEVGDPGIEPGEDPPVDWQEAADEVSAWERGAAVADWDCTTVVEDEMRALRYGYEALFLDENSDRLDS